MNEHKHKFDREEVIELMKEFKVETEKDALEKWARTQYPIDKGIYSIKKIGKSYITILEY